MSDREASHPIASDGEEFDVQSGGQDWVVSWHPPALPGPMGKRHGSAGVCITSAGSVIIVSQDGESWELPGGRPEGSEMWRDTLDREVLEEACAVVEEAILLGFAKSVCMRGPEKDLVLVRAFWRAVVSVREWNPQYETKHRVLVPVDQALTVIMQSQGSQPIIRRIFHEALRAF